MKNAENTFSLFGERKESEHQKILDYIKSNLMKKHHVSLLSEKTNNYFSVIYDDIQDALFSPWGRAIILPMQFLYQEHHWIQLFKVTIEWDENGLVEVHCPNMNYDKEILDEDSPGAGFRLRTLENFIDSLENDESFNQHIKQVVKKSNAKI